MTFPGSGVEKQLSRQPHKLENVGASPTTAPSIRLVPIVYLDELETALYLKVKPNTLRGWRVKGGGPRFRQHGTNVVYAITDLDTWSDGRSKLSTSDLPEVADSRT
jgi:hypothetical protein